MEMEVNQTELKFIGNSTDVRPLNYKLLFTPNFNASTFDCDEVIDIEILAEVSQVVLNGTSLIIKTITYEDGAANLQTYSGADIIDELGIVKINFDKGLKVGRGKLYLEFSGLTTEDMKGFYKTKMNVSISNELEEEQYFYATQFEPCFARRAFFCWDEPNIKCTVEVSLVIPKTKIGLSNMPVLEIVEHENDLNLNVVKFKQTPIMSTYVIAFVIGEFDFVERKTSDGVICRVYTFVGKKELGTFALNMSVKVISYFVKYFDTEFPLPKLDLVCLPDFTSGSMENWGLITLKHNYLLVDEKSNSLMTQQETALILAHEIALQFFGNLVTTSWDELWFKEAFATYAEYLCVDKCLSDHDIWLRFTTTISMKALALDALENSHPIEMNNNGLEEHQMFDTISYLKGVSVVRMLHTFLTDKIFRKGINSYLLNNSYKTSGVVDLWTTFGKCSSVDVKDFMHTWTSQKGFPLIKIIETKHFKKIRFFRLTQEKFCADPRLNENKSDFKQFRWFMPLEFTVGSFPNKISKTVLMNGVDSNVLGVTINGVEKEDWVKINSTGFYRVHYPPSMLAEFFPVIKNKKMLPTDRIGLLDDLFAIVMCGEASTVDLLQMLKAYNTENNCYVWTTIGNVIRVLNVLLEFTDYHEKFKVFALSLLNRMYHKVGFNESKEEKQPDQQLRCMILLKMVELGDSTVLSEAKERFTLHLKKDTLIPAYMRAVIYRSVVTNGNLEDLQNLLQLYREADTAEEKLQIMRALGFSKNNEFLQAVLELILSEEIKIEDAKLIMFGMCSSRIGIEKAWDFFTSQITFFREHFPTGHTFYTLVKHLIENFCSSEKATEIKTFFEENHFEGLDPSLKQALESIQIREAWLQRDGKFIQEYLTKETSDLIIIE